MTHPDLWRLALLTYAIVAVLLIAEQIEREPPEVDLEPVVVQMADPLPCIDDPELRAVLVAQGGVCRP